MREGELVVRGYTQFLKACARAPAEAKKEVRSILRNVGEIVKVDARDRFEQTSDKTAAGYRVSVRQRGIAVEQGLRKVTGRRPDYGAKQMRDALIPAVVATRGEFYREMDHAVDLIADVFEYGSY